MRRTGGYTYLDGGDGGGGAPAAAASRPPQRQQGYVAIPKKSLRALHITNVVAIALSLVVIALIVALAVVATQKVKSAAKEVNAFASEEHLNEMAASALRNAHLRETLFGDITIADVAREVLLQGIDDPKVQAHFRELLPSEDELAERLRKMLPTDDEIAERMVKAIRSPAMEAALHNALVHTLRGMFPDDDSGDERRRSLPAALR
jgi:hypothetical protein